MPRRISFTRAERAAAEWGAAQSGDHAAAFASMVRKMVAASAPAPAGLGWERFTAVCRDVLGDRLALPPRPGRDWYAQLNRALSRSGINEEEARRVATVAAGKFRGPVSLSLVVSRIDTLLAEVPDERKDECNWVLDEWK